MKLFDTVVLVVVFFIVLIIIGWVQDFRRIQHRKSSREMKLRRLFDKLKK
jgi:hypothetical protein